MINLHPAAPGGPAGTWQEVIWQLIGNEAEETGVMMHMVTPKLDKGPPVAYCTFQIRGEPFDRYWFDVSPILPQTVTSNQSVFSLAICMATRSEVTGLSFAVYRIVGSAPNRPVNEKEFKSILYLRK